MHSRDASPRMVQACYEYPPQVPACTHLLLYLMGAPVYVTGKRVEVSATPARLADLD